ncbi:chorismate mutase [Pseudomonas sp. NA-150]|uniref:chorismate mutase n=1 Tax=Pseudomonas sp. NA-150 TaxID=3367525 RepID=UPI0037C69D46
MSRLQRLLPLLAIVLSASAAAAQAPASLAPLIASINERLTIADQVALTKWDSGKPIQDSAREQQVIGNAAKLAPNFGLDNDDVSQFLAAQIEANKLVQYALLAKWHASGSAPKTARPDLVNQIRPQLDELQMRLLKNYADFTPYRAYPSCASWLTKAVKHSGKDPIHQMALIRATGELCIAKPQA